MNGWQRLLAERDWCRTRGNFPMPAYSEFTPPPWLGFKPCGSDDLSVRALDDNWGWHVDEYQEAFELRPGLEIIAREVFKEIVNLGRGRPTPQISWRKLQDNPYWPPDLARHAGRLKHERYVVLLCLALSRTQDDKGRVRWTLFGSSEQGPGRPFWKGFFTEPRRERPADEALAFLRQLLTAAYGVPAKAATDLRRTGLRILPNLPDEQFPFWANEPLPGWAEGLLLKEGTGLKSVRFLLTFRPFARLPTAVQQAYVAGDLHLLPFPGSLVFWGAPEYRHLQRELPFAMQIPLVHLFPRFNHPNGIRIPQVGWLHERSGEEEGEPHTPLRPTYVRTHRWQRAYRDEDETAVVQKADTISRALFSTEPDDLGLYDKPRARNAQLWTGDYRLLLDGPRHGRAEIGEAERAVARGGHFGYRFLFPAMRVGPWQVLWHRPLVAYLPERSTTPVVLPDGPPGYLTAYRARDADLEHPVELWPRLLQRDLHRDAVELFGHEHQPRAHITTNNIRNLVTCRELLGAPLPHTFARAVLAVAHGTTLEQWLASLPERATDAGRGDHVAHELASRLQPAEAGTPTQALTFAHTSGRRFEVAYWKTIATLAHGRFRTKDNADVVRDEPTLAALRRHRRDLDALGDYLIRHYRRVIDQAGLKGRAWAGAHVFHWRTDFDFPWMGGWARNQVGQAHERNVIVRIPGRDSRQAVLMADHYDTAYMADYYDKKSGGTGARVAAHGADDNHSATAMLMRAAPLFLELSKAGKLAYDIWLVHLTGEEFPADCLGARHLSRALVERSLQVEEPEGAVHDLSRVQVRGVYLSDMIGHNNDRAHQVFQISPGEGPASLRLALNAHRVNEDWNALAVDANQRPPRKGCGRCQRVANARTVPALARYPILRGEVRPPWDPRSTLYNTDGQIFSDAGIPVVLFMEDYDINRSGYHDSEDTMAKIDLDYGAALAAIVIESTARLAAEKGDQ